MSQSGPIIFPMTGRPHRSAFLRWPTCFCALALLGILSACTGTAKLKREAAAIVGQARAPAGGARVRDLQAVCWELTQRHLSYTFGSCRPENGGLDCSGTVHYVLSRLGYQHVPRQSNHQFYWIQCQGDLHKSSHLTVGVLRRLKPGDLLFWRGTYDTGKRWPNISHVMIYMGRDPSSGRHWMFGGRSGSRSGQNGAEIDFFEMRPGESEGRRSSFVGWGTVPGMRK